MKNMKVPNVLGGAGISVLLKLGIVGGIGLYAAANNLYNVEGGHWAIVFNRLVGVKDKVIIWRKKIENVLLFTALQCFGYDCGVVIP